MIRRRSGLSVTSRSPSPPADDLQRNDHAEQHGQPRNMHQRLPPVQPPQRQRQQPRRGRQQRDRRRRLAYGKPIASSGG